MTLAAIYNEDNNGHFTFCSCCFLFFWLTLELQIVAAGLVGMRKRRTEKYNVKDQIFCLSSSPTKIGVS